MNDSASSTAMEARPQRHLADLLWSGWPLGEMLSAPWRDLMSAAGAPMRLEEFVEGGELVVRAEIPGIDPDKDVQVSVENGILTVSAERRQERKEESGSTYRSEFHYGRLIRQVRLPEGADPDAVTASYADGILEVRLPAPQAKPAAHQVKIERTRSAETTGSGA
jgi:HSP20 family protein